MQPPRQPEYSYHRSGEALADSLEFGEKLKFISSSDGYLAEHMRASIEGHSNGTDFTMRDAHFTNDRYGIYAVADGIGKEVGSDVASQAATAAFAESVTQQRSELFGTHEDGHIKAILRHALEKADRAVSQALHDKQITNDKCGTTLTSAVYLGENRFAFVNVGDSAAFVVNPTGAVTRLTTEQSNGTTPSNSLRGTGRPRKSWRQRRQVLDEIVIDTIEPGSHLLLLTGSLVGGSAEQRINPNLYADGLNANSSDLEGEVYRLLHLPATAFGDHNLTPYKDTPKPKIDDSTAVVIKVSENDQFVSPAAAPENTPSQSKRRRDFGRTAFQAAMSRSFGKFGEYTSSIAAIASKNKRTPDPATNIPQDPEISTENGLSQRKRMRKFGADIHNTIVSTPWIKFEAYKASLSSRNFEYKTPSKRKLAIIGGTALAAAGAFAAVKFGVDMPDFNMPDFSISDVVDRSVADIEDALSSNPFDSTVEGFAVPETSPQSITLNDTVSSPMEAWNGSSSNTGFFSGTVYDQVAKTTLDLAHNNKIDFDINTLRQQSPSFESSYHEFVGDVLQDNNLTWEQAAQLPAGSTLEIDGDHIQTFFNSQDIALPPVESPAVSTSSQETIIHPALIASVIAAGAAASLGAWLTARRHKKRKNSTQAQG